METDISELEINDELRGMLSGNFETSEADVVERQENIDLPQLPQLLVKEEIREVSEHRFVDERRFIPLDIILTVTDLYLLWRVPLLI